MYKLFIVLLFSSFFSSLALSDDSRNLRSDLQNSSSNFEESGLFEEYILGRQDNYLALDEIEDLLNSLDEDFSDIMTSFQIGQTYL